MPSFVRKTCKFQSRKNIVIGTILNHTHGLEMVWLHLLPSPYAPPQPGSWACNKGPRTCITPAWIAVWWSRPWPPASAPALPELVMICPVTRDPGHNRLCWRTNTMHMQIIHFSFSGSGYHYKSSHYCMSNKWMFLVFTVHAPTRHTLPLSTLIKICMCETASKYIHNYTTLVRWTNAWVISGYLTDVRIWVFENCTAWHTSQVNITNICHSFRRYVYQF